MTAECADEKPPVAVRRFKVDLEFSGL